MTVDWHPEKFNKALKADQRRRMQDALFVVENRAKRRCPKKTGRLAGSINSYLLPIDEVRGRVGTNVFYAIYVELGTKYFSGFFYLRGGLRESYPEIRRIFGAK